MNTYMNMLTKIKTIICIAVLFLCLFTGKAQNSNCISYIRDTGYWYYIYDCNGKKVTTMSKTSYELLGWGSDWFAMSNGTWICLYDINGKKYHTQSVSLYGPVVSIGSQNYVTFNGSWYYAFDKYGRKIDCWYKR